MLFRSAFSLSSADDARVASPRVTHDPLAHLPDDVRDLLEDIERAKTGWRAEPTTTILDLPGVGVCVPDLVLRREGARPVYVEVLGFWSREAVFRRIELAQAGVGELVVFAVSARLRVSAELLGDDDDASLYVYKGRMNARALLARVDALTARATNAE